MFRKALSGGSSTRRCWIHLAGGPAGPGGFRRVDAAALGLGDLVAGAVLLFQRFHLVFQVEFQLLQAYFLELFVFG